MLSLFVSFLALLNPFALFIYLRDVMEDLSDRDFFFVLLNATLVSFVIFSFFSVTGMFIFEKIFVINFNSFKIFGGLVLITYAITFIIQGKKSFITLKGSLDDLASEIALPFMVGAATVSLSIVIGSKLEMPLAIGVLFTAMLINFLMVLVLKQLKNHLSKRKMKKAFDKSLIIILRLTGFFVGAIGVDMILTSF